MTVVAYKTVEMHNFVLQAGINAWRCVFIWLQTLCNVCMRFELLQLWHQVRLILYRCMYVVCRYIVRAPKTLVEWLMAGCQHFTLDKPSLAGNTQALVHTHCPKLKGFHCHGWLTIIGGSTHQWSNVKPVRQACCQFITRFNASLHQPWACMVWVLGMTKWQRWK